MEQSRGPCALRADPHAAGARRRPGPAGSALRLGCAAAGTWLALGLANGCSRAPVAGTAGTPVAGAAPRATLEQILKLRDQQQYLQLDALVIPGRARDTMRFLMAIDNFLAENRRLCDWIRDHVGVGLSQTIDQSYVADDLAVYAGEALGVFSRGVELLDTQVTGDTAVVAYSTGPELLARRVTLRRNGDIWRLDPGPIAPEPIAAAFDDMAHGLALLRGELENGRPTAIELRDSPDLLTDRVRARLRPGVAMLSRAHTAPRAASAAPGH